jgi:hypothetical protein
MKEGIMPKEFITDSLERDEFEPSGLRIGWSKETGHVQVATVGPDEYELEPTPEGNGWFVTLDRAGINRAIRALRQARDDAFGKDE